MSVRRWGPIVLAVTEKLNAAKVPYRILHTRAHIRVLYEVNGMKYTQVCSKTPSCRLSAQNAVSQVQRALRNAV